jgi:hypothetical protein
MNMDNVKRSEASQDESSQKEAVLENGYEAIQLGGREEKIFLRKMDSHLIPVIMLLYLLSFLDR